MKDKDFCKKYERELFNYNMNAVARRVIKRNIFFQKYHKEVLSAEEGNQRIKEMILSGQPFMAGRFGGNELHTVADVLYEKFEGKHGGLSAHVRKNMTNVAGFFPDEKEMYYRFEEVYLDAAKQVDLIAVWDMFLQAEIVDRYMHETEYIPLRSIEPYYFDAPWSKALEGKKVLVIHPFVDTIAKQYEKRKEIFENKNVLPQFELVTMKSLVTLAGKRDERFATWFDALEYMKEEALKKDFDIALVGCGAYGFPLAAEIKKSGKQVVHMGGSLQILFGVKGARWDNHEIIGKMYNDAWVRPGENERVSNSKVVEGGCYW